jgi:hypothetical protein
MGQECPVLILATCKYSLLIYFRQLETDLLLKGFPKEILSKGQK